MTINYQKYAEKLEQGHLDHAQCSKILCSKCAFSALCGIAAYEDQARMKDVLERIKKSCMEESAEEKAERKKRWIASMVNQYYDDDNAIVDFNDLITHVVRYTKHAVKLGYARCNSTDEFDSNTGLAIAYARACNITIPDFVLN